MNHKRRGMGIIFCHTEFDNLDLDELRYSKQDSDRLKHTMEGLGFEVSVYENLKRVDLMRIVDEG
jgi:hypothetical protein